jgi:hypothetical protein
MDKKSESTSRILVINGDQQLLETRRMLLEPAASVITLKPAIRYQFKTGQRDWPKT